jgi:hypothetical protein
MSTYFPEFQNQRRRKKEVWADVSKELIDEGYPWSAEDCRKKWSNMVRTFKGIHEQKMMDPGSYNAKKVKWPFFDDMLELFMRDGSDSLPEAANVVQFLNNSSVVVSSSSKQQQRVSSSNTSAAGMGNDDDDHHHSDSATVTTVEEMSLVEYQAIINAAAGSEITLVETGHHHQEEDVMEEDQPATSGRDGGNNGSNQSDTDTNVYLGTNRGNNIKFSITKPTEGRTPSSMSAPSVNKSYLSRRRNRKRCRTKSSTIESSIGSHPSSNAESMVDKLIAATTQQNDRMLEKMSSFHEETLSVMKQRNEILSRLCDTLEKQSNFPSFGQSRIIPASNCTIIPCSSTFASSAVRTSTTQLYSISSAENSSRNHGMVTSATIRELTESMIPDGVSVAVDSDTLHTLISHDPSSSSGSGGGGGLTFHLEGSSVGEVVDVNDSRVTKAFRLENIPSDVNLSAFSATLHPTLVSTSLSKKPKSSLSKSVSVPLHTTSSSGSSIRKIAMKKDPLL